jgi:hypothetical protein
MCAATTSKAPAAQLRFARSAAALRSRTAGSPGELRCSAIHKQRPYRGEKDRLRTFQRLGSRDVGSNSATRVSIGESSAVAAKYFCQFTSGKPMRVAWAGSCSRSSVPWRPGSSVSASKTTRCSGSCQRRARSSARIAARPDAWSAPGGPNAAGPLQSARRTLDSRSSTSCELVSDDISARGEGQRSDCSQVARQIQRETREGSAFRVNGREKQILPAKGACRMTI